MKYMDKHKLIFPISILLGCIILGGFFYVSQVSKQKSIEKQQQIELQAKQIELEIKTEQDKKEYIVKRKKDCYDLETSERKKFNNVDGSYYNEEKDICVIRYIDPKWDGKNIFGEWDEAIKDFVGGKYFTKEF